jgi:hypothetical protein
VAPRCAAIIAKLQASQHVFRRSSEHGTLMLMRAARIVYLGLCLLVACTSKRAPPAGTDPSRDDCAERDDGVLCNEQGEALSCRDRRLVSVVSCGEHEQVCVEPEGCVTCRPGERACDGNSLTRCSDNGSAYELLEVCGDELACSPLGCRDLCAQARSERSYIGCEYFPVFTSNAELDPLFKPAVVIANPNLVAAQVTLERAGQPVADVEVAPGGVETVMLNYVAALRTPPGSALVRGGAYHLVSSVPVTVHQFNPLLFEIGAVCKNALPGETDGTPKCNSLTNDASLLLPAHVLSRGEGEGSSYLVTTRPTMLNLQNGVPAASSGFVAIVGAGSGTVNVVLRLSAHTRATTQAPTPGPGGDEPATIDKIEALSPGASLSRALAPGDVLQLLSAAPAECPTEPVATRRRGELVCPLGADYDLTGTEITADGPIAVIAGHNCAYVPFDRTACDHLEESMFPVETWSTEVVVPRPRAGDALPQVVRVVSALDDNLVRFEPEAASAPRRLGRGESFELLTSDHLVVRADKPISVAQFLIGQDGEARVGDPSMTIAIPTEQYRARYAFLSPKSYDLNYVSLIAHGDDRVILDGVEISEFTSIGDGAFKVAAIKLVRAGAHEVHSKNGQQLGLQIYGYGDYTSYMLPGGLDLRVIGFVW